MKRGTLLCVSDFNKLLDRKIKAAGVDIIIALGHSGYEIDLQLAENIAELDLVVGGHSHTFLYTDTGDGLPSNDQPEGDYPTYVPNKQTGKVIPVVQAHCYTKYLGHLQLSFDASGDLLTPVDGVGVSHAEPILLDESIEQDQDVLEAMLKWQRNLTEYKEVLGVIEVYMAERRPSEESNIGEIIDFNQRRHFETFSFRGLHMRRHGCSLQ